MKIKKLLQKALDKKLPPRTELQWMALAAEIAINEWLKRYAKPENNDPIGLADELLHEIDEAK